MHAVFQAQRLGLKLTPGAIMAHQTIAELAAFAAIVDDTLAKEEAWPFGQSAPPAQVLSGPRTEIEI